MRRIGFRLGLMVLAWTLATGAGPGRGAEIAGVSFAEQVKVGERELPLQGVAVLKWGWLFDVYAGAFYLPAAESAGDWYKAVSKRLELAYFRDIAAEDFASSSTRLLRRNLSEAEFLAIEDRLEAFCRLFRDVAPGDRYSLTFQPGEGTSLRFNGELLGTVPGTDFARAYFGIWLGENPISTDFRDRLLAGR